jgi:formylglycine-generating enzyme required for sulfatase activity
MRPQAGRADLVLALALNGVEGLEQAARLLGYEKIPEAAGQNAAELRAAFRAEAAVTGDVAVAPGVSAASAPLAPIPFWRLIHYEQTERPADEAVAPHAVKQWRGLPQTAPRPQPVCPWPALMPRLRSALAESATRRDPDIPAIVRLISEARPLARWPRRSRRCWPARLQIVEDFAVRLTPVWTDQKQVTRNVSRLLPKRGVSRARLHDGLDHGVVWGRFPGEDDGVTQAGSAILVISDLGLLDENPEASLRQWMRYALERQAVGRRCAALTPAPPGAYPDAVRQVWTLVAWDDVVSRWPDREAQAERLLGLLSYAVKIPPGLLRDVRRLCRDMSVMTEIDVWRSASVANPHPSAAMLKNSDKATLHKSFREAPPETRRAIFNKIRQWCGGERDSIYLEAVIGLGAMASHVVEPEDLAAALALVKDMAKIVDGEKTSGNLETVTAEQIRRYVVDLRDRTHDSALEFKELERAYSRLCDAAKRDFRSGPLPAGFDPSAMANGGERHVVRLTQQGSQLEARYDMETRQKRRGAPGSFLANIDSRNDQLVAWKEPFWKAGAPPAWAASYGVDDFGPWVEITVTGADGVRASQRMRWIRPGRFMMGSPEDEPGRYDEKKDGLGGDYNEGPQHEVHLSVGYWLFDTPVTQELWLAVMGENPSRFVDPRRPVDSVSWEDEQRFLKRINEQIPGLDLAAPTEAQWEYACRAGTTEATYAGPMKLVGANNAPVLDAIAWYGGNSGVGFELENGWDSSDWPEKQYEHNRAGSHPVKTRSPNAWGLYDMLGNVWEWCSDGLRKYEAQTVIDPVGPEGAYRALRGGAWDYSARGVRSAGRLAFGPVSRFDNVGFRCARVRPGAEPADLGLSAQPERALTPGRRGGAGEFSPDPAKGESSVDLPKGGAFVVRSDCEIMTFAPMTRPSWASAMGRDKFGLWVELTLGEVSQRMRWIGPGRFMMGSPGDEPGRLGRNELGVFYDEGPQHEALLSKGYWLFDTPVTQALWMTVMGKNPSHFSDPLRPVEQVSWEDAAKFLERVNSLVPGFELVLPTEAQWEYACRGGTTALNYAGRAEDLGEIAWFNENSGGQTHPVRGKQCNAWGLYDMLGNVWEWCGDGNRKYDTATIVDPVGPEGANRARRGGAWYNDARLVRSANRGASRPADRGGNIGFRCARVRP